MLSPPSWQHWTDPMLPSGKSVPILDQSVEISTARSTICILRKGSNMSSHAESDLFQPVKLGAYTLANRIVMAPLTRNRANASRPTTLNAEYYCQRATAGLIITEATQISQQGTGLRLTPGLYSEAIAGWKQVTDASMQRAGGSSFSFGMSAASRTRDLQPNGGAGAPNAISRQGKTFSDAGFVPSHAARARDATRSPASSSDYRKAAGQRQARRVSTASRSTAPTATCSTSSCATAPISVLMLMADRSKTVPVLPAGSEPGSGGQGLGWRPRRHPACHRSARPTISPTAPIPNRCSPMCVEQLNRFGLAYLHLVEACHRQ